MSETPTKPEKFSCPICTKNVSDKCNSIQCDICGQWVHQLKCSGLTHKQFVTFCLPTSEKWFCPVCLNRTLPFPLEVKTGTCKKTPGAISDRLKSMLSDLNKVVTSLNSDEIEDELEFQFQAHSCSFVECKEFNSIVSKSPSKFSAFHLNIASMSKHFDELGDLLALLSCNFSVVGISETKSLIDSVTGSPLEKKRGFCNTWLREILYTNKIH